VDKWREDVYTWCKVHVVEGMDTCPWVYHRWLKKAARRWGTDPGLGERINHPGYHTMSLSLEEPP
jgi:hypothetical protein